MSDRLRRRVFFLIGGFCIGFLLCQAVKILLLGTNELTVLVATVIVFGAVVVLAGTLLVGKWLKAEQQETKK